MRPVRSNRVCLWLTVTALLLAALVAPAALAQSGSRPTYTDRALSAVPNAAAITRLAWVPGLDQGFIPQGMTVQDGSLFLAGYVSTDPQPSKGPCRLYRLDPRSGTVTGLLAMPGACGHAGGIARGPPGRVFVADTRAVFEIQLAATSGTAMGAVVQTTQLEGRLLGSFAAAGGNSLWLGGYRREGEMETRLYRIPFDRLTGGGIDEAAATASLPLPDRAQGAAFDAQGRLWITRSGAKFGELLRLHAVTGAIEARWDMPAGIEDISFGPDGQLWSVSEAGTQRWLSWTTFFPLVFRIDTARLR